MSLYRLEELFPEQLQDRLTKVPILVLPFGTIEWHSHHLPLGLDGLVAQALGERMADKADAVLAPTSYWGAGGVPYPHTLKLPGAIIEPLLVEAFGQFGTLGFRVIVAFTGHFGLEQTLTLKRSGLTVMQRTSLTVLPLTEYDLTVDIGYVGDHASVGETSLMWALRPDLVRLDAVPPGVPLEGIVGEDPRGKASIDFGRRLVETISERAAAVATRLLRQTSPLERALYIEAVAAGVRALEQTARQRRVLPKEKVPPITTPAYRSYCQAIFEGDYARALGHIERKLAALSA